MIKLVKDAGYYSKELAGYSMGKVIMLKEGVKVT